MKSFRPIHILLIVSLLLVNLQSLSAKIYPVVISEVFYDSPLEEDRSQINHHNGEFIELFNPTNQDIILDNWKIVDISTTYYFPTNTIIPARGLIIVAYQYPNSGFKLSDLFPSINNIDPVVVQKSILYQSNIILNNSGEIIKLYNENSQLVDQVSYNHTSTFDSYSGYWDICAHNGSSANNYIANLVSLQRNNIHYSTTAITPLASDFSKSNATPLQNLVDVSNYPILSTLYDYDETNNSFEFEDNSFESEVGALPGTSSVTPTGAATYQIPIEVPPGTNGSQPNLSVVYNSQGGNGILGQGWDISGLSAISRGTQNFYYDAVDNKIGSTSVKFNSTDRLYLDGQRLVVLNYKENFSSDAEYGKEIEDYSRIKTMINSSTNQIYFVLTTKEGVAYEYGGTSNSIKTNSDNTTGIDNRVIAWNLNKITDVNGNSIIYEYSDRGQYIKKISYLNNDIDFVYEDNSVNPQRSFIGSFLISQTKLLKSININSASNFLRAYNFSYLTSDMDLRLDAISLTAADGKKTNPTKVKWDDEAQIVHKCLGQFSSPTLNSENDYASFYFEDVNNDGIKDRIELADSVYGGTSFKVFLSSQYPLPEVIANAELLEAGNIKTSMQIGDINNDGFNEIILILANRIDVYRYDQANSSMILIQTLATYYSAWTFKESDAYYLATLLNLNNDNYLDMVIVPMIKYPCKRLIGSMNVLTYFGSNSGFTNSNTFQLTNVDTKSGLAVLTGDFNADGKLEFVNFTLDDYDKIYYDNEFTIKGNQYWFYDLYKDPLLAEPQAKFDQIFSTDVNNDGYSDMVIKYNTDNNEVWALRLNKKDGTNFSDTQIDLPIERVTVKNNTDDRQQNYFFDYNGDGYSDLIILDENWKRNGIRNCCPQYQGIMVYMYKNSNGKFILEREIQPFFPPSTSNNPRLGKMNAVISDINGDGVADLIYSSKNYMYVITKPNAKKRFNVKSIVDGMGLVNNFTYENFINNSTEEENVSSKIRNIKAPIVVVDTYTDVLGTKTTYNYSKPKFHMEGKGFLGFETTVTTNDVAMTKTINTYVIDPIYFHVSLNKQENSTTSSTLKMLSTLDIKTDIQAVGDITLKRYMAQVTEQTTVDFLKNVTQKTINNYNEDGVLERQEVTTGDNTSLTEYLNYKKRNSEGLIAYLPQQIKVTKKRSGGTADITNTTDLTYYDGKGLLNTKKENVGKYGETLTTYTYYLNGPAETITVKPKDNKESVTTYRYDGDNYFLFPKSVKTTVEGTDLSNISYTYDYTTGNVKTKTDNITNQTISYGYDAFGRVTQEIQPNGAITVFTTSWDNTQNSVYKKTAQSLNIDNINTTYYDKYGREVYKTTTGWKGQLLASSKSYNSTTGLIEKVVHPHYEGEVEKYTTYYYNDYIHRLTSEVFFDGVNSLTTSYSYSDNSRTTSVTSPSGQTKTTVTDASGLVISVTDGGGTIEYKNYNADGQPTSITSIGATTTIAYDEMGRKQSLNDPNAGTITYTYYADGQLDTQTSAKGDLTKIIYDNAGRVKTKTITNTNGGTPVLDVTTYTYVPNGQYGVGQVKKVEQTLDGTLSHKQEFTFNTHQQIETAAETYDGQTITTSYGYDVLWRPTTTTTPSGLVTTNVYDQYGDIYQVQAGSKVIWEGKDQNSSGQWLKYTLGNGLQTNKTYSNRQELETIITGEDNNGTLTATIQNLSYEYQPSTGNLLTRNDILNNRNEVFTYDALDRLLTAQLSGSAIYNQTMIYQPNGNINVKSDVGTYLYESPKPNAMSGFNGVYAGVTSDRQFIDYTTFNKVSEIRQGLDENTITKKYNIYYGLDEQRIKTVLSHPPGGSLMGTTTRYYFGAYEKDIDRIGNATQTDYIYTPAGLTAMMKGGVLYYLHTENLGSIQAITDESKTVISSYYYTPWGGRVLLSGVNITDRGYTFHEHLEPFCLINMNGRVYDPMLARFLSPDPYVQAPDYTQNFNRYSYCLNNPFKYTDPSGESVILAAAIGAVIGGIGYTASIAFSDYGLCAWNSNDFCKSMAVGAISGAVTCGIGAAFGTAGSIIKGTFDLGNELARAGVHALANGFISSATGGEFLSGFVAGGMGSFGGSLFQGMAGGIMQAHPILEAIGTVSSSALSGGAGAELTGGDFWRGAATGAIVGLLNHELGKIAKKYILDSEVIILEDTEGAGYKGHMAIATGNDKKGKGWTYVSKYAEMIQGTDGQQEMDGNLVSGGKAKAVCIHYNTKVELLAANSEYDRFITFKTTYYGALNAAKTTYKASIGYYHFMFSNCSHAVANGLNALGLYFGSSIIPNERFEQIYNYYSK